MEPFRAEYMLSYGYTVKLFLAVIGSALICFLLVALLSLVTDYLFFTYTHPLAELMDPESDAVELSKHTNYLIAGCLIWLVSITVSGYAAAKISAGNRFLVPLLSGGVIFVVYYALLPDRHIIEIYPNWYTYLPLIMALTALFIGPAISRHNHKHNS